MTSIVIASFGFSVTVFSFFFKVKSPPSIVVHVVVVTCVVGALVTENVCMHVICVRMLERIYQRRPTLMCFLSLCLRVKHAVLIISAEVGSSFVFTLSIYLSSCLFIRRLTQKVVDQF